MRKESGESSSSTEEDVNKSESNGASEQARIGSEKIGQLEFQVQDIQYSLLKIDENENKSKKNEGWTLVGVGNRPAGRRRVDLRGCWVGLRCGYELEFVTRLQEVEEALVQLADQLRKESGESSSSTEEDVNKSESNGASEQARIGSEKIGQLEFQVQDIQYSLLKIDENENKSKKNEGWTLVGVGNRPAGRRRVDLRGCWVGLRCGYELEFVTRLQEVEEALVQLADQLRKESGESSSSTEEDVNKSESNGASEQARIGSEKIGQLEFQVQDNQYSLLKIDENENKSKKNEGWTLVGVGNRPAGRRRVDL
ncbi:hypothetical protein LINPERPRIM_LOCUS29498, partial [Linum perenne]